MSKVFLTCDVVNLSSLWYRFAGAAGKKNANNARASNKLLLKELTTKKLKKKNRIVKCLNIEILDMQEHQSA